jgi:isovaleryl-CoA dehydrogenase
MLDMGLDFALGEMADTIRDTTQRFAADRIAPLAARIDEEDWFPVELWPEMGELGLHGITVAEEDGGLGLGYLEHVVAQEEVARASASIGLSYGAHSNLCVNQIRRWANPEQKAKYLPKLISGEHVGSLAMSEAGAGSDVVSMKLKADKVQGGYVLNGTNSGSPTRLMPTRSSSMRRRARARKASPLSSSRRACRASRSARRSRRWGCADRRRRARLQRLRSAGRECDGPVNGGVGVLMSGSTMNARCLPGSSSASCRPASTGPLPYIRDRKQFGKPIGAFQLMQAKIADMYVALNSARAYVYTVARNCDAGKTTRFDAAGAILLASRAR